MCKIYEALENLPQHLITKEIAQAAIEEGQVQSLNYLPKEYLSEEVILSIIEKSSSGYCYHSFDLGNIPEELRVQGVCDFAVEKSIDNILHTPEVMRNSDMLMTLIKSLDRSVKHLSLFSADKWSVEHLLVGVKQFYSKTQSTYGPRGGYHGTRTTTDLKPVLVFMSYAPKSLINSEFYAGLFETQMSIEDIDELTPSRYKDKEYWRQVAGRNFELVPESCYDYNIMLMAIQNHKLNLTPKYKYSYSIEERYLREQEQAEFAKFLDRLFAMMDDKMADEVIKASPYSFKLLPEKHQTPNRLMLALEQSKDDKIIDLEGNEHLFTEPVCKAYIYRNKDLPTLPATIWSEDFVDCCMTYGTNFRWFSQLPKELQTIEIVEKALDNSNHNARFVRPELITLERAMDLYRPKDSWDKNRRNKEYVPVHYLEEFVNETGLDEMFFGGEVSYDQLRNERKTYTYCRIGHSFLGYVDKSNYGSKNHRIVLTRRTPASFKPIEVFDQSVSSFHTTWLEKLIAENDPAFVKPSLCSKGEKALQVNSYFALDKHQEYNGVQVYTNSILGEVVYFTAKCDKCLYQEGSFAAIKKSIDSAGYNE